MIFTLSCRSKKETILAEERERQQQEQRSAQSDNTNNSGGARQDNNNESVATGGGGERQKEEKKEQEGEARSPHTESSGSTNGGEGVTQVNSNNGGSGAPPPSLPSPQPEPKEIHFKVLYTSGDGEVSSIIFHRGRAGSTDVEGQLYLRDIPEDTRVAVAVQDQTNTCIQLARGVKPNTNASNSITLDGEETGGAYHFTVFLATTGSSACNGVIKITCDNCVEKYGNKWE